MKKLNGEYSEQRLLSLQPFLLGIWYQGLIKMVRAFEHISIYR